MSFLFFGAPTSSENSSYYYYYYARPHPSIHSPRTLLQRIRVVVPLPIYRFFPSHSAHHSTEPQPDPILWGHFSGTSICKITRVLFHKPSSEYHHQSSPVQSCLHSNRVTRCAMTMVTPFDNDGRNPHCSRALSLTEIQFVAEVGENVRSTDYSKIIRYNNLPI